MFAIHRPSACSLLPRLAAAILLAAPLTACLPKAKPPATLISPRELGVHELSLKVTLPDEAAPYENLPTSSWVKPQSDGQVYVDFKVDQSWETLILAPTSTTKTVEEEMEEAEHAFKDFKLIDQGPFGDAGWFLMYSIYIPAHLTKDAYGAQKFVNARQVQWLRSRVKVADAWFTCEISAGVDVLRIAAKICSSVEPWAPQPAAAPQPVAAPQSAAAPQS